MKKWTVALLIISAILVALQAFAGSIDEVTFLTKIQPYDAKVNTVLVTQEGRRISITKGTRLNVAGFTSTEAFVISRKDNPSGFVKRTDITPVRR